MAVPISTRPLVRTSRDGVALYAAIAAQGFQRYSTYRAATLAGVFTNSVFGIIYAFTFIALWEQRPELGGYGVAQALTFCWLSQALIMPVGLFGGGLVDDFSERVRSGAVAIDLHRPLPLLSARLAEDLGRAAYQLLARGLTPTLVGALLFDLAWPRHPLTWALFAVSVLLAVVVGFSLRFLLGLLAFWIVDVSGPRNLLVLCQIFFSGSVLPLVTFPGWLRSACDLLPFRCLVQIPIDVFLREDTTTSVPAVLSVQLGWVTALLALSAALTGVAVRKVVVQGG